MEPLSNLLAGMLSLCTLFFIVKRIVPGPCRWLMRIAHKIGTNLWHLVWKKHYERRGLWFALWHVLIILALVTTIAAFEDGRHGLSALFLWCLVLGLKWCANKLRILRSERLSLPSRRRW